MTQELQALLERINEDGVRKAQAERDKIITEAEKKAAEITEKARSEAEATVNEARSEAELLARKGEESLRQASRDILLSLREQLQKRLAAVARACLAADTDAEAFAEAIANVVGQQLADKADTELEVLVAKKDQKVITDHLFAALGKNLRENVTITPLPDQEGGFSLRFDNSDVFYDFSDSSLADTVAAFLSPRLVAIFETVDSPEDKGEQTAQNDDRQQQKTAARGQRAEKPGNKS